MILSFELSIYQSIVSSPGISMNVNSTRASDYVYHPCRFTYGSVFRGRAKAARMAVLQKMENRRREQQEALAGKQQKIHEKVSLIGVVQHRQFDGSSEISTESADPASKSSGMDESEDVPMHVSSAQPFTIQSTLDRFLLP